MSGGGSQTAATKKAQEPEMPALSALERERCDASIQELDSQLESHRQSRLEPGKIARELKPLYAKSGRKGGGRSF